MTIKYHENINAEKIYDLIKKGQIDTLKWLRFFCCPWYKDTCKVALENNQMEIFNWAIENGCHYELEPIELEEKTDDSELFIISNDNCSDSEPLTVSEDTTVSEDNFSESEPFKLLDENNEDEEDEEDEITCEFNS